ncbi:MAG TPA: hypothetical protein PLV68_19540 [Ilumatobacteraceae bacterium]|nr:hypothetical protein [Ilumatobacteraceae bacterium]
MAHAVKGIVAKGKGLPVELTTILSLKASGHLGDISSGALYFQNATIVAARAATGTVAPSLVHFGGMPQTAVIGRHTFYRPAAETSIKAAGTATPARPALRSSFVGGDPGTDRATPEASQGETVLVLPDAVSVAEVARAP